ncbi:MAG: hypothetical protein M3N48_08470 [Verrucomicrobiota bacterium]|nr:hypothetical protein [Verrucomicrobiota bacterium]
MDNQQVEAVREYHAHVLHPPPSSRFTPVIPTHMQRDPMIFLRGFKQGR